VRKLPLAEMIIDGVKRGDSITVVIPAYNSEASLPLLVGRLSEVLPSIARDHEIIIVNDGSHDGSWRVITELADRYKTVQGINLLRNYGQQNALLAGIRAANFSVCITMDDDLQHPPEEIPKLLAGLDAGADVVYGVPARLQHGFWRNFFSRFSKWAMGQAMGIDNLSDINAFRALRTNLRTAFSTYESPNVLLDVLLSWGTVHFSTVVVEHQPRTVGRSNYTPMRLFNHAMLMLTGFSTAPLRFASSLGFLFTLFGVGVLIYVVGRYFISGGSVPGFPFLASVIAIFAGAQLFALGIIGEYLGRIFNRSMQRPVYVVKETLGQTASGDGVARMTSHVDR
jgi:glycosyltransferase involved in cell wall biosynthesis